MEQTNRNRTGRLVRMAILAALTIVLGYFNIPTFGLEITLAFIPVIIGAVFMGISGGVVLGGLWGVSSFITGLTGANALVLFLMDISPFYCFIVCVPTRMMVGLIVALLWKCYAKIPKKVFGAYLAGVTGPLLNTIFFMSVLFLLFLPHLAAYFQIDATNVLPAIVYLFSALAGINCIVEATFGCIITGSVIVALWHYEKSR